MKKVLEAIPSIKSGKIEPVYLLNGNDFFLQKYVVDELESVLSKNGQIEKYHYISDIDDFQLILNELYSAPLFPQQKLIIYRNPTAKKKKAMDELLTYCKKPNQDNCLIIIVDKFDQKSVLINKLSKVAVTVNTSSPFTNEMKDWVTILAIKYSTKMTQKAVDILIETAGDSVYHLANEIQKFSIGLKEDEEVTEATVEKHSGWDRNYFPWHFLDAVGNKDFNASVIRAKNLMYQGMEPTGIVSSMTNLMQELLLQKMKKSGESSQNSNTFINLSIMNRNRMKNYLNKFQIKEIELVLKNLATIDKSVKSASINFNSLLIPLLYRTTTFHG